MAPLSERQRLYAGNARIHPPHFVWGLFLNNCERTYLLRCLKNLLYVINRSYHQVFPTEVGNRPGFREYY